MEVNTYNEKELLLSLAQGEDRAFASVFHHYRHRIYAIAFRLLGSASQAEDVVQDIFLKMWLKRGELHEISHFKAYLFTVTRNHIFTSLKLMARQQLAASELSATAVNEIKDAAIIHKEYEQILQRAIAQLSPQQELIYKLSKEEGLKRNEIADRLQLSPETIKVHLANAMRSIRAFCMARMDLNTFLIIMWLFY
ncbi:RNA polymerase sigma-70 factor (ECF subfamily) [Chitinophaga polysaccharea]|uniref:RNA polymerase sigma-70 factor (ECF subfamily) n=1 Tax=Chitinophaga polysaccharea TaxID=1293035 RepID=A0A561PRM4_9BACT|nr:RNA polymerase sigma-70 factor [Chitinophaga polysaccharea]TWF40768.1 RNA polymerase sigma-70 factor (ECF subfamily) [Chitinophaga polysaccharea]